MSAPRIPNSLEYWKSIGKNKKDVALYLHNDLDGIYSAVAIKGYLEKHGFRILTYGVIDYQESWKAFKINKNYINICVDFGEYHPDMDVFIDHHNDVLEDERFKEYLEYKKSFIKPDKNMWVNNRAYEIWEKTRCDDSYRNWLKAEKEYNKIKQPKFISKTKPMFFYKKKKYSAYESICDALGIPTDKNILGIISMVDAAKYDEYGIDIKKVIDFNIGEYKTLFEFGASFNQLIRRGDFKTIVEVVANTNGSHPSILNLFRLFKLLAPANNLNRFELNKAATAYNFVFDDGTYDLDSTTKYLKKRNMLFSYESDFVEEGEYRLNQMKDRTRGKFSSDGHKKYINSQEEFVRKFTELSKNGIQKIKVPGYQILGQLVFVPSGAWANPARARAIIEQDIINRDILPTMSYNIPENNPFYKKMLLCDGQEKELVGDIIRIDDKQVLNIKQDVTNNPNIEGISGLIEVKDKNVVFLAKQPLFFILLQYGNTLQIVAYHKMENYVKEYLPKYRDGKIIDNLGDYCAYILSNFQEKMGYSINPDYRSKTKSGGHKGIGTISNIFGEIKPWSNAPANFVGSRYLDLFKNKIIKDLSLIDWSDMKLRWSDPDENIYEVKEEDINKRIVWFNSIRKSENVRKDLLKRREKRNKKISLIEV